VRATVIKGYRWNLQIKFFTSCATGDCLRVFLNEDLWAPFKEYLGINTEVYIVANTNSSMVAYEVYFLKGKLIVKQLHLERKSRKGAESLIERRGDFLGTIIKGVTQVSISNKKL